MREFSVLDEAIDHISSDSFHLHVHNVDKKNGYGAVCTSAFFSSILNFIRR